MYVSVTTHEVQPTPCMLLIRMPSEAGSGAAGIGAGISRPSAVSPNRSSIGVHQRCRVQFSGHQLGDWYVGRLAHSRVLHFGSRSSAGCRYAAVPRRTCSSVSQPGAPVHLADGRTLTRHCRHVTTPSGEGTLQRQDEAEACPSGRYDTARITLYGGLEAMCCGRRSCTAESVFLECPPGAEMKSGGGLGEWTLLTLIVYDAA